MIYYIQRPHTPYAIDFSTCPPRPLVGESAESCWNTYISKIHIVMSTVLRISKNSCNALAQGTWRTARQMPRQVMRMLLGYSRADRVLSHDTALRVAYFFFSFPYHVFLYPPALVYSGLAFLLSRWVQAISHAYHQASLASLPIHPAHMVSDSRLSDPSLATLNRAINPAHLFTREAIIDDSEVPSHITVRTLLEFYDAIQFDDPTHPHYLNPRTACVDEGCIVQRWVIKNRLKIFISNVEQRNARLSQVPPPGHALNAFYDHITRAVRVMIHKCITEMTAFKQAREGRSWSTFSDVEKREYRTLCESQGQLAIALGIAAGHCGSRYMNDTTVLYRIYMRGEEEIPAGNLKEQIEHLLTAKREQIAEEEVAKYVDRHRQLNGINDSERVGIPYEAHLAPACWAVLGPTFNLPGMGQVIESGQPLRPSKRGALLLAFSNRYTPDAIIEVIKHRFMHSAEFRELVLEWFGDQVGIWSKELHPPLASGMREMNEISRMSYDISSRWKDIQRLLGLIEHLKQRHQELPVLKEGWNLFLSDLLDCEWADLYLKEHFPEHSSLARIKGELKKRCAEAILGEEACALFLREMKAPTPDLSPMPYMLLEQERVRTARSRLGLADVPTHTIKECFVQGDQRIREMLTAYVERQRKQQFLHALGLDSREPSSLLLEWLLVMHGVFRYPPSIDRLQDQEIQVSGPVLNQLIVDLATSTSLEKQRASAWLRRYTAQRNGVERERLEEEAVSFLIQERGIEQRRSRPSIQLITYLYQNCFALNPQGYIQLIKHQLPPLYSGWRRVWHHTLLPRLHEWLTRPCGQIGLTLAVAGVAAPFLWPFYMAVSQAIIMSRLALPLLKGWGALIAYFGHAISTHSLGYASFIGMSLKTVLHTTGSSTRWRIAGLFTKGMIGLMVATTQGKVLISLASIYATVFTPAMLLIRLSWRLVRGHMREWVMAHDIRQRAHEQEYYRKQGLAALFLPP